MAPCLDSTRLASPMRGTTSSTIRFIPSSVMTSHRAARHLAAVVLINEYLDCSARMMNGYRVIKRGCNATSSEGAVSRNEVRASITSCPEEVFDERYSSVSSTLRPDINCKLQHKSDERTVKSRDQRRTDSLPELPDPIKQPALKPRSHLLESHERTPPHDPHRDLLFRLLFLHSLDCLFGLLIFPRQDPFTCRLEDWVDGCILA
jgi:hypothetical protein